MIQSFGPLEDASVTRGAVYATAQVGVLILLGVHEGAVQGAVIHELAKHLRGNVRAHLVRN
jgi:hypothetical protein